MKYYIKTTSLTLLSLFIIILPGIAQIPIYNFSFDSNLDGWTTVGVKSNSPDSAANAVWMHTADGTATLGAYSSDLPIVSLSGGGAVFFDSDFFDNAGVQGNFGNGRAPAPQRSELISPDLDFSTCEKVHLAFNQYYRYFARNLSDESIEVDFQTPNSVVEVSNDGGNTWTSFLINEDVRVNRTTRRGNIQVLDISAIAAGQSQVQVRFVWEGEYYFWIIDDVRFFKELGQNLSVVYITLPSNFQTPDLVFECDSFDMELRVANHGDTIAENVQVTVNILDADGASIYADTGIIQSIAVGDSVNFDFERDFKPPLLEQGTYVVNYTAQIGETDTAEVVNPADNNLPEVFVLSDLTIDKTDRGDGYGFALNGNNTVANYYRFPEEFARFQESFNISRVYFDCFSTDAGIPLTGNNVLVYAIELPEDVIEIKGSLLDFEADLVNFDINQSVDDFTISGNVIGIGSYQFTQMDENQGGPYFVEMVDFEEGEGPVVLNPGKKYLIAVRYDGNANTFAQEMGGRFMYFQITTLVWVDQSAQWFTGGFGVMNTALIGMELELITAVDENPLPENTVRIYPNPANDYIQVDWNFDTPTDAGLIIADISGKILKVDTLDKVTVDRKLYPLNNYSAGTYVVRIATKDGTRTERIIIQK